MASPKLSPPKARAREHMHACVTFAPRPVAKKTKKTRPTRWEPRLFAKDFARIGSVFTRALACPLSHEARIHVNLHGHLEWMTTGGSVQQTIGLQDIPGTIQIEWVFTCFFTDFTV